MRIRHGITMACVFGCVVIFSWGTKAQVQETSGPIPATASRTSDRPAAREKLDEMLKRWEQAGAGIRTLDITFTRDDVSRRWNTHERFDGRYVFKGQNGARCDFIKILENGEKLPAEELIVTPNRTYQFFPQTKQVFVFERLNRDERQFVSTPDLRTFPFPQCIEIFRNLLAQATGEILDGTHLPFLFVAKAGDLEQHYKVDLLQENPATYLLRLSPREDKPLFNAQAWIWLDKPTHLPRKVQMVDPGNQRDTKTLTFTDIRRDLPIADSLLDAEGIAQELAKTGWKRAELFAPLRPPAPVKEH